MFKRLLKVINTEKVEVVAHDPTGPNVPPKTPKFIFPETLQIYLQRLEDEPAAHATALAAWETKVAQEQDAAKSCTGEAVKELARRSAKKVEEEAPPVKKSEYVIAYMLKNKELQTIIMEGVLIFDGGRRTTRVPMNSAIKAVYWRRIFKYKERYFLVFSNHALPGDKTLWVTDSVAQMTEKELQAIVAAGS